MNPFKEGTTSYHDFNTLSDLQWHCTKCELKSGQAKTWQVWRQEVGVQMDTYKGQFYKYIDCPQCNSKTVHRKLKSLELDNFTKSRSGLTSSIAKKIKELYNNVEAFEFRQMQQGLLEVDHRFPQVRWDSDEDHNDGLTDEELKQKFILLTRQHNLWKARICSNCVITGKRGSFPGIKFWYNGYENWDEKFEKSDFRGCIGCFWYDPFKWREALQKVVNEKTRHSS